MLIVGSREPLVDMKKLRYFCILVPGDVDVRPSQMEPVGHCCSLLWEADRIMLF